MVQGRSSEWSSDGCGRRLGYPPRAVAVAWSALGILAFEPLAVYLAYLVSDGRFAGGNGEWNGIYAAEAALGGIGAVALWRARLLGRR